MKVKPQVFALKISLSQLFSYAFLLNKIMFEVAIEKGMKGRKKRDLMALKLHGEMGIIFAMSEAY